MKTVKKFLSLVLVLIMCFSVIPMTDMGIEASAANYDASAALAYAAAHWNDGVGLCAEFVSNCLKAGGLKSWSNGCTRLMNQMVANGEGSRLKLNTSGNYISASNNNGKFSLGDPVFWRCDSCGDYMHVGLISGIDSSGYITHYAHNSAQNNKRIWVGNCYNCGRAYSGMYVMHFADHYHSYISNYEAAHPHNYYEKCSCGDWYYTGTTNDSYTYSYEAAHPHKEYKTCWCGNTSYTGGRKTVRSCESCWDIEFTTTKESISIFGGRSDTLTLGLSGGVFPEGAKYDWEYDESVISVEKNGNNFTVTGLRYASTDLIFTAYTDSTLTEVITSLTIPVSVKTPAIYFIFYNPNGGENAPGTQTKTYGNDKILSSDEPTREGYTFLGWSTDSEATDPDRNYDPGDTYSANERITLYAVWKKVFYGDINEDGKISLADVTALNNMRLFGTDETSVRILKGDLDGDGELTLDDLTLLNEFKVGNITSFPVEKMFSAFEIESDAKKLKYKLGEEISVSGLTINVIYNNCTVHNIDTGFTFSPTIATGTGKQKVTVTLGDWSVDYYIIVEDFYTLSYNANGGSGAPSTQTGANSYIISSTVPTRQGYTFLGWSKSSSASSATYKPGDSISLFANTTLYAVWKAPESMLEGEGYEVSIDFAKQELYYTFIPIVSGEYAFESFSSIDTKVYVYNSSWTQIGYNDDGGVANNFLLYLDLVAGNKYYVKVGTYGSYTGDLTFGVALYEEEHTHAYSATVTTQATCTKTGVRTYKCSCGESYTETISKTSHDSNTTIPMVSATCTKTGLTEGKKCSVCGTVTVAQQTVAVIAHTDNNSDYMCDYGCGHEFEKPVDPIPDTPSDPTENCGCNCHKGGIAGFFFKIILFFQKLFKTNKVCACGVAHY